MSWKEEEVWECAGRKLLEPLSKASYKAAVPGICPPVDCARAANTSGCRAAISPAVTCARSVSGVYVP